MPKSQPSSCFIAARSRTSSSTKRAYHREKMNALRSNPIHYKLGNLILAKPAVKSNKAKGIVGKAEYAYTGPWEIVSKLHDGSYQIKHKSSGHLSKKHTMHLQPILAEHLAFAPLNRADSRFGQFYKNINTESYEASGIKEFLPHNLFKGIRKHATTRPSETRDLPFPNFPALAEPNGEMIIGWNPTRHNDKMPSWTEEDIEAAMRFDNNDDFSTAPMPQAVPLMTAAHKKSEACKPPTVIELHALLLQSRDRLSFIAHCIPGITVREWQLVQVAYADFVLMQSDCLTSGRFLVDFFILHPDNCRYNAANQRY